MQFFYSVQNIDRTSAHAELPALGNRVEVQIDLVALDAAAGVLRDAVAVDIAAVVRDDVQARAKRDNTGIDGDRADAGDGAAVSMSDISLAGVGRGGAGEYLAVIVGFAAGGGKHAAGTVGASGAA